MENSPAASAGVRSGDVVTAIGAQPVADAKALSRAVADLEPGTTAQLTVWRNGEAVELAVTIGETPSDQQVAQKEPEQSVDESEPVASLGVGLSDVTPDVRQALGLSSNATGAVVRSVDEGQPAAESGIRAGDIIVAIGPEQVKSAQDAKQQISSAAEAGKKSVLLLIERDGARIFVAVPFRHA
jgi:serine protease Do